METCRVPNLLDGRAVFVRQIFSPHQADKLPESKRLPRQPIPKRVGSSEVKRISSIEPFRNKTALLVVRGWPRDRRGRQPRRHTFRHLELRRCAIRWPLRRHWGLVRSIARKYFRWRPDEPRGQLLCNAPRNQARALRSVGVKTILVTGRRFRIGNQGEFLDLRDQPIPVNLEIHAARQRADGGSSLCKSNILPASFQSLRTTADTTAPSR